jgi:hypothetical protein
MMVADGAAVASTTFTLNGVASVSFCNADDEPK